MTEEEKIEYDEFYELLAQQMFHVMSDDLDDETGAKLEEVILVQLLANHPRMLKYKPLKQWVEENVGTCYSADVQKQNEEILAKQNQKNNV